MSDPDRMPDFGPDLEQLVEEFRQSGLRELHARVGGLEVYLSRDADAPGLDGARVAVTAAPVAAPPAPPPADPVAVAAPPPDGATLIPAPYLGTFYRAPKPGADNYVEVGSVVTADTELCLVEVMKLFTAVRAGVAGRVARVLARDGELVQAGQPLFAIEQD
jgi:acetyl-CoA carboxylase biotin carboxyl carrier protein